MKMICKLFEFERKAFHILYFALKSEVTDQSNYNALLFLKQSGVLSKNISAKAIFIRHCTAAVSGPAAVVFVTDDAQANLSSNGDAVCLNTVMLLIARWTTSPSAAAAAAAASLGNMTSCQRSRGRRQDASRDGGTELEMYIYHAHSD